MIVRAAQEADAPAMARVMVDTYMSAHKGQIPEGSMAQTAGRMDLRGVGASLGTHLTGHCRWQQPARLHLSRRRPNR